MRKSPDSPLVSRVLLRVAESFVFVAGMLANLAGRFAHGRLRRRRGCTCPAWKGGYGGHVARCPLSKEEAGDASHG